MNPLRQWAIKEIRPPDIHHLNAAQGWIGLGNFIEARRELVRIKRSLWSQPDVLEVRYQIHAHRKEWKDAAILADGVVTLEPGRCDAWIHRSFALHELKRTQEAFDKLLPAAGRFPAVWTIPYNLACYCAQLGRLEESRNWLNKAKAIDPGNVLQASLADPDLKPLRDSLDNPL